MPDLEFSPDEMMTVEAARRLANNAVCFVGIGLPSAAANLARLTHAPDVVLIYESGAIDTRPTVLPLSIGDGELAETARVVVSVPEMFRYWLQGGRIDVGFLGAAQVDRYGNLNTTVIGSYDRPSTRLPGAGGAPEIAASSGEVLIILRQSRRSFVERLDFVTSVGFGEGGRAVRSENMGRGPAAIISDIGVLEPDPECREFVLTRLHPGRTVEEARAATGWPLRIAKRVTTTEAPKMAELATLRELHARTDARHGLEASS